MEQVNNNKIIFILFFSFICSCNHNSQKSHQLLVEKGKNGSIISKIPYYISQNNDTIVDGIVVYYFPKGNVEDSFTIVDGKKDGYYYQYDTSGYLKGKLRYEKGKKIKNIKLCRQF